MMKSIRVGFLFSLFALPVVALGQSQVSWETLANVQSKWENNRYVTEFSSGVLALDGKSIKVQGFMLPLEMGQQHEHFMIAARPAHCYFDAPGGKEMIEIYTDRKVDYAFTPVTITGKLEVLKDDQFGMYYRIRHARVISG